MDHDDQPAHEDASIEELALRAIKADNKRRAKNLQIGTKKNSEDLQPKPPGTKKR